MSTLLLYPASLFGGRWADGPRVKPELVALFSELRRGGEAVAVVDLEAELGNPEDDAARQAFLGGAERLIAAHVADLVVISCWSALQYSAAVAVAERVRRAHPAAVIAVEGHHVSVRPDEFAYSGAPFNWLVVGEAESAVLAIAQAVRGGDRDVASVRPVEGTPLPLDAAHLPDLAEYPYATPGLPEMALFLSRGCPLNAPECLLRPGGGGWHAYPPEVALAVIAAAGALGPKAVRVLDPAFGYDPAWRREVLDRVAAAGARDALLSVRSRPETLVRLDVDKLYLARTQLYVDVGTLSEELLYRTGIPEPRQTAAHAVDLLAYLNAKGVATIASFTFNQPGETEATAAESLDAIAHFVDDAPNSSVRIQAQAWAYMPTAEPAADLEAPARRFGTRIEHPEWWAEPLAAHAAATAVVASSELAGRPPGDESYWRPRFEELRARLEGKLTEAARRGLRSHEGEGSAATGVPHGWWTEARWH